MVVRMMPTTVRAITAKVDDASVPVPSMVEAAAEAAQARGVEVAHGHTTRPRYGCASPRTSGGRVVSAGWGEPDTSTVRLQLRWPP